MVIQASFHIKSTLRIAAVHHFGMANIFIDITVTNKQSWGNLVTCNLSYVIFITFQVKSNITKLLYLQVICNLIILLSEVILLFIYSSYVKVLFS